MVIQISTSKIKNNKEQKKYKNQAHKKNKKKIKRKHSEINVIDQTVLINKSKFNIQTINVKLNI